MRAREFINKQVVAESKRVEYQGVHLDTSIDGATVNIHALTKDGTQIAYVVFDRDGNNLTAIDLAVDDSYKGKGIAKSMYDYVKSLGFKIHASTDQTAAGKAFWDKNSGEERVWEARKNVEFNPKVSVNHQIFNALKKHKETFRANNLEIPNVFVSFTKLPKLGINPQSRYRTPIGIYAYPANYVISEIGDALEPRASLPFAGDQPYANIFSLKSGAGVLVVSNDETALYKPYYEKLGAMFSEDDVERLKLLGERDAKVPNHMGGIFWYVTMKLAEKLMRQRNMESMSLAWNYLFRAIGIQAVIDNGDGIIHENEPTQMTVFDPSIVTDVTLADNKYSKEKIRKSVQRGEENIKKKQEAMQIVAAGDFDELLQYLYYRAREMRGYVIPRLSPELRLKLIDIEPSAIGFIKKPTEQEIDMALSANLLDTLHYAGRFVSDDKLASIISKTGFNLHPGSILKYNKSIPVLLALVKINPNSIMNIYDELSLSEIPTEVWRTAYSAAKQNPFKYTKVIEWLEAMNGLVDIF